MARLQTADDLRLLLERVDGRGYGAYKDLRGVYQLPGFRLYVDHVQGDPFAAPSRLRVVLEPEAAGLAVRNLEGVARREGVACYLARRFADEATRTSRRRGSGNSGRIEIAAPGQAVYGQTAVQVEPDGRVESRFAVGLPAAGRRALGAEAAELLLEDVPAIVSEALSPAGRPEGMTWLHAAANEDAEALREAVIEHDWVAFLAEGSILPRRSGIDDGPLGEDAGAVPLRTPEAFARTIRLPHAGPVRGMAIPKGVSLIVGGGFHGKSTLLRAIAEGVWNHRPGDGRERCATVRDAVKVRAEDGRSVAGVDISPFIGRLPGGRDTRAFSTANASGSTSQAASIQEALEAGASALLIDEDTAATNFMIRDRRMQALVLRKDEPITPFVDRVRALWEERGVSTVLVVGGSGDYLDVADHVLQLRDWLPVDVGDAARAVATQFPTGRSNEAHEPLAPARARVIDPGSLHARKGRRERFVRARGMEGIQLGERTIDLSAVEQIVAREQVAALAEAVLLFETELGRGARTLPEALDGVMAAIERGGLDVLDPRLRGDLAAFRRQDLAGVINRLRGLEVRAD
jgi:predicted ABC-class ATPase